MTDIRYAYFTHRTGPRGTWEAAVRRTGDDETLVGLGLLPPGVDPMNEDSPSPLTEKLFKELAEYLDGRRTEFDIPLAPEGTEFRRAVWDVLRRIPYGETRSYKEVALALGDPNAARAVGGACNRNPILVLVPCHRVIGASGDPTGFALGLNVKTSLLELEATHRPEP